MKQRKVTIGQIRNCHGAIVQITDNAVDRITEATDALLYIALKGVQKPGLGEIKRSPEFLRAFGR
eukprot:4860151-Alexandrium_andersonii.AAC.1